VVRVYCDDEAPWVEVAEGAEGYEVEGAETPSAKGGAARGKAARGGAIGARGTGHGRAEVGGVARVQREVLPALLRALMRLSAAEGALEPSAEVTRAKLREASGAIDEAIRTLRELVVAEPADAVPLTEVLEQVLTLGRRGGAEVSIDVQDAPAIRGAIHPTDLHTLTRLAARAVRELGGRRRRVTPVLDVRVVGGALEVFAIDRAAAQDELRIAVSEPLPNRER
jgi:hypothetical protein